MLHIIFIFFVIDFGHTMSSVKDCVEATSNHIQPHLHHALYFVVYGSHHQIPHLWMPPYIYPSVQISSPIFQFSQVLDHKTDGTTESTSNTEATFDDYFGLRDGGIPSKSKECLVTELNSGTKKPCKFPFIHNGETFNSCTTNIGINKKTGKPAHAKNAWCSTKTTQKNVHVKGKRYYGDCPQSPNCQSTFIKSEEPFGTDVVDTSPRVASCLVREKSSRRRKPCQFPFVYLNQTFTGCTKIVGVKKTTGKFKYVRKPWCSTKKDSRTNQHISDGNYYGDCPSNCPIANNPQNIVNQRPKIETPPIRNQPAVTGSNSGLWIPDAKRNECGTWLKKPKKPKIGVRVVGGKDALSGEFPWMALLGYDLNLNFFRGKLYLCGGSVINKWYVLTAAHCVQGTQGKLSEIVLGEHLIGQAPDCFESNCNPPTISRGIQKIIVHKDYNNPKKWANDIALIRLDEAVPLYLEDPMKSGVKPVCLPWSNNDFGRKTEDLKGATVAGWGRETRRLSWWSQNKLTKYTAYTQNLQYLLLPIANEKCTSSRSSIKIDPRIQLCAGGLRGEDSCEGDSGGPLMAQENEDTPYYQIGLVSFGTNVCASGVPGVYTKVTEYLLWIESKMEP